MALFQLEGKGRLGLSGFPQQTNWTTEPGLEPAVSLSPWLPPAQLPLRVRERSGAMETGLKWLDWRETGAPNCSEQCSPGREGQIACYHSRCWWSVGWDCILPIGAATEMHQRGEESLIAFPLPTFQGPNPNSSWHQLCNVPIPTQSMMKDWSHVIVCLLHNSIPLRQIRWAQ